MRQPEKDSALESLLLFNAKLFSLPQVNGFERSLKRFLTFIVFSREDQKTEQIYFLLSSLSLFLLST